MSKDSKSHEVLTMWLELQRAVAQFSTTNGLRYQNVVPWDCADKGIHDAWARLIQPENLSALKEWDEAEEANFQPGAWTKEAIKQCHVRSSGL